MADYQTYQYLSLIDLIVAPLFLIIIFIIEWHRYIKKRDQAKYYRYYLPGLFAKIFGGIGVCFVYVLFYKGGDTMNYFFDHTCMTNLFFKNPSAALKITFTNLDFEGWSSFDSDTRWPIYSYDRTAFFVDRVLWILCVFSFKSYVGETILLAWISYYSIWRLYETMVEEFPDLKKQFAIAILFVPSVFFWGSGILKDTITFACVCLFTSCFYSLLIKKRDLILNILLLTVSSYLLIRIKPYIFFALLPGSMLWIAGIVLSVIKSRALRLIIWPVFAIVSLGSGYLALRSMENYLGAYALSNVLNKAVVSQQDLKREEYGGSSFDIGDFDPSLTGILSKAHLAINATLFRPYLWEARNPAVLISAIENLAMMIFTIILIIRLRVYNLFRLMFRHHLLVFTVSFSLFFAFSVGLTTSNFGSLVRYKIPAIPFYVASLFIIRYTYVELKQKDQEEYLILQEETNRRRDQASTEAEML